MWLRIRQIAGVAEKLQPVEDDLKEILGIEVCYRDPGVGYFGLENALFPIGDQLLEVVAPIQENTAGGRYIERRGGDSGYMVITQCDDHPPRRAHVDELGIRIVLDNQASEFINLQLHPRDTGGTFFEIDQQLGEGALNENGPWHPAGPPQKSSATTLHPCRSAGRKSRSSHLIPQTEFPKSVLRMLWSGSSPAPTAVPKVLAAST